MNFDFCVFKVLQCISKQYAHLQTLTQTPVKFQGKQHKTVGGVEYTRYQVSIHFGKKWVRLFSKKSDKII